MKPQIVKTIMIQQKQAYYLKHQSTIFQEKFFEGDLPVV